MLSGSVPFARDIQNYTIASGTIISLEGQTISVRLGNGAVARGVRINSPLRPYLSVERKGTLYYDNGSWVLFCLNYQQGDDEQDSVGIRYTLGRSISTHAHTIYAPVAHAHAYADEGHSHAVDAYTRAVIDAFLADKSDVGHLHPAPVVYSILTDGNLADPQLIFVGGDVILVPLGI